MTHPHSESDIHSPNPIEVNVEIVRSGRNNLLTESAGSITTYGQANRSMVIEGSIMPVEPTIVSASVDPVYAQEINKRRSFIDELNRAISFRDTVLNFQDSITIINENGNCVTVNPNEKIKIKYGLGDYFTLNVVRDVNVIPSNPYPTHELVNDLNIWMDKVWKMRLDSVLPAIDWFRCPYCPNCGADTNQRFVTNTVSYEIGELVDSVTGLKDIMNKEYFINGRFMKGSNILYSIKPTLYMADRLTRKAYISTSQLYFYYDLANYTFHGFSRQTQPYGTFCTVPPADSNAPCLCRDNSDCRDYCVLNGTPGDKWWKAWIDYPDSTIVTEFTRYSSADSNNIDMFRFIDTSQFTEKYFKYILDNDGYLVLKAVELWIPYLRVMKLMDSTSYNDTLFCSNAFSRFGDFYIDSLDCYKVKYKYKEFFPAPPTVPLPDCGKIECLEFCPTCIENNKTFEGVISDNARTFTDSINKKVVSNFTDEFNSGKRGKWREEKQYVYKTGIVPGAGLTSSRIYQQAGVFNDFTLFNWKTPIGNNNQWLNTNTVTQYDEDGKAIEERNILGLYNSVYYDNSTTNPILMAKNAKSGQTFFNSYERTDNGYNLDSVYSHSGKYSVRLKNNGSYVAECFDLDDNVKANGVIVKIWCKTTYNDRVNSFSPLTVRIREGGGGQIFLSGRPYEKVAQTGEWSLYSTYIEPAILNTIGNNKWLVVDAVNEYNSNDSVWVDDFRLQPKDAEMVMLCL